jgi:ABC-2 type transport system permease protein
MNKRDLDNTLAIFKREFLSYFNSPVLYVIVVIYLLASMGFTFFFGRFLESDNASLTQTFFFWHPWIYIVLAPAVGMRLWSEEHRLGTFELLMTMPLSPWQAIIGKFVAAALVWLIGLALTFPVVLTVYWLGSPDLGSDPHRLHRQLPVCARLPCRHQRRQRLHAQPGRLLHRLGGAVHPAHPDRLPRHR